MNCQTRLHGTYCPTCGQRASTQRLRFRKLAAGLVDGLFELDFKTVRTAWHLMVRPGATARSYVDGNRVSYLSPLRYYLIVVALNIGLAALLGTTDVATAGANDGNTFWDTHFVALQISLLYAGLALLIAVALQWLHRSASLTLAEHYAFLLYVLAQSILILAAVDASMLALTGVELKGEREGLSWLAVFTAYVAGAGRTFYGEPLWRSTWKAVAAIAAAVVASAVAVAIILSAGQLVGG
jgi:hypothetical protein